MAEKKRYEEFRELLRDAFAKSGCESQKEFAERIGISNEHLNRLLHNSEIARPSKKTLQKILSVSRVNPRAMFLSCEYDELDAKIIMGGIAKQFDGYAQQKFMVEDLTAGFLRLKAKAAMYSGLKELFRCFVEQESTLFRQVQVLQMQEVSDGTEILCKGTGQVSKDVDTFNVIEVYFILTVAITVQRKYILTGVEVSGEALALRHWIPEEALDAMLANDVCPLELEFFAVTRERKSETPSPEKRLLQAIFGETRNEATDLRLFDVTFGIGSVYKETPSGFLFYVMTNQTYFGTYEEEYELLENLLDLAQKGSCDISEIDAVCASYSYSGETGTGAVICKILNQKIVAVDSTVEVEYHVNEQYTDRLYPVIFVREDTYWTKDGMDKEKRDKIDAFLREEMRALGMPTYGQTVYYSSITLQKKDMDNMQEPL